MTSARYELGNELSIYMHINDEVAETLKKAYGDMTFYPEEYLETELRRLGNLNTEGGGSRTYTNMFGEEHTCIVVAPYDEEEYGLYTYVWKENGYGIEVARQYSIYGTLAQELHNIFVGELEEE